MTTRTMAQQQVMQDRRRELAALIQGCIRHLRQTAHLDASDRRLLDDAAKSRYGFTALDHLCRIAATCDDDAHAMMIPEAVRGFVLSHRTERARVGFFPSMAQEQTANGTMDLAQLRVLHEFTKPRLECLIEDGLAQEAATRRLIDEAHIERAALCNSFTLVR